MGTSIGGKRLEGREKLQKELCGGHDTSFEAEISNAVER